MSAREIGVDRGADTRAAERLAALAEEELGLVAGRRWDELPALHARRDAALADLPADLPDGDRVLLERALALQRQLAALIERARAETAAELGRLDRGRAAARGYAAATGHPHTLKRR